MFYIENLSKKVFEILEINLLINLSLRSSKFYKQEVMRIFNLVSYIMIPAIVMIAQNSQLDAVVDLREDYPPVVFTK